MHRKQKISLSFAGRNLSVVLEEINGTKHLDEQFKNLSMNEEIFLVKHESDFYTEDENRNDNERRGINPEFLNSTILTKIQEQVLQPLLNFKDFPVKPTKGYIFHGQSGTGKTEFLKYIKIQLGIGNVIRLA